MKFSQAPSVGLDSFIACAVADVTYAIDIKGIREIVQPSQLVKLPHSPAYILGTLEHQKGLIPMIDLRHRLGFEAESHGKNKWVLIESDGLSYGIAVDQVYEVFQPAPDHFFVAPNSRNADARLAKEFVSYSGGTAYILNLSQLTTELESEMQVVDIL